MKKKITAIVLCVAMLAIAITSGTLAYFTDNEQATNEYAVGSVEIDLYETVGHKDGADKVIAAEETLGEGSDDATNYKYENVQPGDTMKKVVTVKNTGKSTAYIALTIKQDNYDNFNDHVDAYYENMASNQLAEIYGGATNVEKTMQKITDDVFCGDGWGLNYSKTANSLRYMMVAPNGTADGEVTVLGYGYTNVDSTSGKVWRYAGDIFPDAVKGATELDGNFQSLDGDYTRMWVIYLEVPAGASYTVDLTTVCPTYFDNYSTVAFENMTLDVKAFAIQTAGFATAKDAFTELFKAKDCFAY